MSQGFKKSLQNAMLLPRKSKYEKDYRRLIKEYEERAEKIEAYVNSQEIKAETSKKVTGIEIDEIIANLSSGASYDNARFYFVYDKRMGTPRSQSTRIIYEFLKDNPRAQFVYGDEDYCGVSNILPEEQKYKSPRAFRFYKPVFSPETLASFDYINAFAVKGKILNNAITRADLSNPETAMYELTIEICSEIKNLGKSDTICHIPAVFVTREIKVYPEVFEEIAKNGKCVEALREDFELRPLLFSQPEYGYLREKAMSRLQLQARNENPSVSIIIPSKDNPEMLLNLVQSMNLEAYDNVELIVVDNGSSEEAKKQIEDYLINCNFVYRYIYEEFEFNYSKMNNLGAERAKGEVLILLNDDIECADGNWIMRMASEATVEGVGCVGCKLLYPDGKIQHVGIVGGFDGPAHLFMGEDDTKKLGQGENLVNRNVLAVTGACLAVKKELYDKVGGLCEDLKVGYNDVDLCMNLYEEGYRNVLLNDVVLIHHESASRGVDAKSRFKSQRLMEEKQILKERHPELMKEDPYLGGCEDVRLEFVEKNQTTEINTEGKFGERTSNDDEGWIYSSFEKMDVLNINDKKAVATKGFAVVPGMDNMRFDFEMIFEKDGKQFIVPTQRSLRTDLAGRFKSTPNTELCGFNVCFDASELESGTYAVKMYAKDHGNVRELITDTDKTIEI